MAEAAANWSGDRDNTGGDDNSGAQNVGDGDVYGPMLGKNGHFTGISIGKARDIGKLAESITIHSLAEPGKPIQTFSVKKMRIHATPASVLAVVSSIITVATFFTGGMTIRQLWEGLHNSFQLPQGAFGIPTAYWWLLAFVLSTMLTAVGWGIFKFLRQHVLWVPRFPIFRALAGVRTRDGKTRLASFRLSGTCIECPQRNLRFRRDEHGPKAICPRHSSHTVYIDITKNEFDEPIH